VAPSHPWYANPIFPFGDIEKSYDSASSLSKSVQPENNPVDKSRVFNFTSSSGAGEPEEAKTTISLSVTIWRGHTGPSEIFPGS